MTKQSSNAAANIAAPSIEDLKALMAQGIRAQIEAELETDLAKVQAMQEAQGKLKADISTAESRIRDLKATLNEKASQLHEVNAFLAKFSPEGIEQLINDRLDLMLAAMNGQTPAKKAAKRDPGTRNASAQLEGYAVQYAIDGEPRAFGTKTHLTYFLGKKLGRSVMVDELNRVFMEETGTIPFTDAHKGQTLTASFEGIQVSITLQQVA